MINYNMIDVAMAYSKSGTRRLKATWMACEDVDERGVPGDFVECGVWRGGNVMVARWAAPSRRCWLFDTFEGMTEPGPNDTKRKGEVAQDNWIGKSAVSEQDVFENMKRVNVYDSEKMVFVPGDVRLTLQKTNLPQQISVLRLDTDFYDSTKIEMEVLYPRLQKGGYLIVDDYGHWMGARKAVDECLGEQRSLLKPIDYTGAWMKKP